MMTETSPKRKMVRIETIRKQLETTNKLLASAIPQSAKRTLCTMIESILMEVDLYQGYNYNYWLDQGCDMWYAAAMPDFPEKDKYIIGTEGEINKANDDFVSDIEGEYSRVYKMSINS